MRSIYADECLLLASFIRYPELIACFNDLERKHFSSEFPWVVYSRFVETDLDHITKNTPYIVANELSNEKKITSDEFGFFIDDFNEFVSSYTAQTAYQALVDKYETIRIKDRLHRVITNVNDLDELKDQIAHIVSDTPVKDEPMQSIITVSEKRESAGFDLGFPDLQHYLDIEKTDLVIIAARPFSGKTTLAVQFALEVARLGKIHFWSMEMSKGRIRDKVDNYGHRYKKENFMIREATSTTIQRIHKQAMSDRPVAIFIDQLNKVQGKGQKEYEQFTSVARGLKELAGVLQIPIFCLAQINRDAEDGKPKLFQLKGSGSIEEEADVVMMLHVEGNGRTALYLDKNRTKKGHLSAFNLTFNMEAQVYSECIKRVSQ